ncbi:MAG TPA: SWIM zinc finger family protein [Propionibacteriaceae bacterium]|nr:SWIM zinc finger family protein [Propionibacteriaceae bacterium]
MDIWPRQRVLSLAPDRASIVAATALAGTRTWLDLGTDSTGLWGSCAREGRELYQTVVDLGSPPAYACSCPSRKVPCKHALALLLQWSDGLVPAGQPPPFAAGWLDERASRKVKQEPASASRQPGELADPAAAAKRAAARAERVAAGLDELDQWLCDQIRGGLAGLERAGYAHFDTMAARMVDAQASGVAGMLRAIPAEFAGVGWPSRVLEQLGALHLLVQAHRRLDELPVDLAATVRARIGYSVSKSEVLTVPGLVDHWFAVGMVDTAEYRLDTRRVWLYGAVSGRWAVIMSFAPPGGPLDDTVLAGYVLHARLHFYPGSGQFRALLGEQTSATVGRTMPPAKSFAEIRARFAQLVAADPWAARMPAVINAVPVPGTRPWRMRAPAGECCEITDLPEEPWPLLARSGGEPIEVFGEWTHRGFRPLSVLGTDATEPFSTAVVARAA